MNGFYLTYNNVIDICDSNDCNLDRLYLLSDRNYIFAFDYIVYLWYTDSNTSKRIWRDLHALQWIRRKLFRNNTHA